MRTCSIEGCDNRHKAHGLCQKHYVRVRSRGTTDRLWTKIGEPAEFIEILLKSNKEDCIIWPFSRTSKGYAILSNSGELVTRIICKRVYGKPIDEKNLALHSCGKGHLGCVNPKHLRWGSYQDNTDDSISHKTMPKGSKNGLARLNEEQVLIIKDRLAYSESIEQIAKDFGVAKTTIQSIKYKRSWSWLNPQE